MKLKKFKKVLVSSVLVGIISLGTVYAAAPTTQQAYYDTFTFKVNGVVQYISDITKKPFIANSRIYVPISTLSDLGIAKVEWIPSNGGVSAELRVTPSGNAGAGEDKIAYYEQKFNEMATQIAQKDTKIKELETTNKTLLDENTSLKTDTRKSSSSISNLTDREVSRLVSDLQYDVNKDRDYNRLNIDKSRLDVTYEFDFRRNNFEVKAYVKGLTADNLKAIKDSSSVERDIRYLMEDVSSHITKQKEFKDVNVYLTMYDSSNGDREIASYDYKDSRLRGNITLK